MMPVSLGSLLLSQGAREVDAEKLLATIYTTLSKVEDNLALCSGEVSH